MFAIILSVIIGLAIAIFATQNTNGVTVTFAQYQIPNVPVYLVVIGSLLLGLFVAWVMSLFDFVASFVTMRGKNATIHQATSTIDDMKARIHTLERENARLKGEEHHEGVHEEEETNRPTLLQNLRHRFA